MRGFEKRAVRRVACRSKGLLNHVHGRPLTEVDAPRPLLWASAVHNTKMYTCVDIFCDKYYLYDFCFIIKGWGILF